MKEMMRRLSTFVAFDNPSDKNYISAKFASVHHLNQEETPQWSTNASRQKLISAYWFTHVASHFAFVFGLSMLLTDLFLGKFGLVRPVGMLVVGLITFPVLLLFCYWPNFGNYFLPSLETIKDSYECKQLEHQEKCRKTQLSNLALALIFYVFDKTSRMNALQSSDQYAGLLVKLYGVDKGSLKANLELIIGHSNQRKNWTERRRTEIENRFAEAYQFFEELDFVLGIKILKDLESNLLKA